MRRITIKDLEYTVDILNVITNSPTEPWTKGKDGKLRANVGNYHLSGAYGGWKLERMDNESGGVSDVLHTGYVSKRELHNAIKSFQCGIVAAK